MDSLALRVAAKFFRQADEGESEPGKGGVPARWQDWLNAAHGGGKDKVPNPNSETSSRYKEVSYSTALKDKRFFGKAMKEYYEWAKKHPEDGAKSKEAPKKEDGKKPSTAPTTKKPSFSGALNVKEADIDKLLAKHKKDFEAITADIKKEVDAFSKTYAASDAPEFAKKEWEELPMEEKLIHVGGHKIGALFEKSLNAADASAHKTFTKSWMDSSSNPTSMQVHGALSTLGVKGHQTAKDKEHADYRESGAKKDWLKDSLGQAYSFAQAYYKHIGLKEVSLYRGVVDDALSKADTGTDASIETRELSSFTSDPKVAATFGRPLKMKVPVENILWSNLNTPGFTSKEPPSQHGEAEIAVMGASDIPGKIIGKAADKLVEMDGR